MWRLILAFVFFSLIYPRAIYALDNRINFYFDDTFSAEALNLKNQLKLILDDNDNLELAINFVSVKDLDYPPPNGANSIYLYDLGKLTTQKSVSAALLEMLTIPVFSNIPETTASLQQSNIGRAALGALSFDNIVGFEFLNAGTSFLALSKMVHEVDDLAGRKLAATHDLAGKKFWNAYGAETVEYPSNQQMLSAVQAGTIDAVEFSPQWIDLPTAEKTIVEFSDFSIMPSGRRRTAVILAEADKWGEIPYLIRVPLADAIRVAAQQTNEIVAQNEEKGIAIYSSAYLPTENAKGFVDKWSKTQPELYQDLIRDVRQIHGIEYTLPSVDATKSLSHQRALFVTNRGKEQTDNPRTFFNDNRTETLSCGTLTLPENQEQIRVSQKIQGTEPCLSWISKVRANKEIAFFIHGYRSSFYDAAVRALEVQGSNPDKQIVLWSWPSRGEVLDYPYDKASVGKAYLHTLLARSFYEYSGKSKPAMVLAHSMGSELLVNSAYVLKNNTQREVLAAIVFAAPDVSTNDFSNALDELTSISPAINMYTHPLDWALRLSYVGANHEPRIGLGGYGNRLSHSKLYTIEVQNIGLFEDRHSYVFTDGRVKNDLSSILHGQLTADSRGLHRRGGQTGVYYVIE